MNVDIQTAMFVLALVSLVATLLGAIIRGVWRLSTKLGGVETTLRDEIAKSRNEVEEKQDMHSREFGETVHAMRQKMADFELWVRDHCVQLTSFDKVQQSMEASIRSLGDELKARLERMETKIDSKT